MRKIEEVIGPLREALDESRRLRELCEKLCAEVKWPPAPGANSERATHVGDDLVVTDTRTSQTAHYTNPLGRTSPATTDTAVFATCP